MPEPQAQAQAHFCVGGDGIETVRDGLGGTIEAFSRNLRWFRQGLRRSWKTLPWH